MNTGRKRKGRSDRSHVIYQISIDGDKYIGVTFVRDRSADKSVRARIVQHWYNAHVKKLNWRLSSRIRMLESIEDVEYAVLEVVRGKTATHERERQLIDKIKPSLNTDVRPQRSK